MNWFYRNIELLDALQDLKLEVTLLLDNAAEFWKRPQRDNAMPKDSPFRRNYSPSTRRSCGGSSCF